MARVLTILLSILAAFGPGNVAASALPDWGRLDRLATGRASRGTSRLAELVHGRPGTLRPVAWTAPIPATPELLALLETIHDQVGRALAPRPEPAGQDLWRVGARAAIVRTTRWPSSSGCSPPVSPRERMRLATAGSRTASFMPS